MSLNKQQQEAYNEILYGTAKIVLLLGKAGTGKTYTVSKAIEGYQGTIAVTATTNKAKEVLSSMAKIKAYTTHSFAGFTMVRQGRSQYLAPVRDSRYADLVIIEEVSMLPQSVWQTIQRQLDEGSIKKVVMLGDPIQLPAIGITIDFKSLDAKVIELTEQMRQANNPELDIYFSKFRKAIQDKDYSFDPLANLPSCITVTDSFPTFVKLYKQSHHTKKLIAYSNSVVDKYNTNINNGGFRIGDDVILDKPLGIGKNGDVVQVVGVNQTNTHYELVLLVHGEYHTVKHFLSKTHLNTYINSATSEQEYWDKVDTCYNLKHQYACTVHKSQGSSYDNVFVDLADIKAQLDKQPTSHNNYTKPIAYSTYLRLVYVALSRMRDTTTIYLGTSRAYKLLKEEK